MDNAIGRYITMDDKKRSMDCIATHVGRICVEMDIQNGLIVVIDVMMRGSAHRHVLYY